MSPPAVLTDRTRPAATACRRSAPVARVPERVVCTQALTWSPRTGSVVREDDELLGRAGHRDVAVDDAFDAVAVRLGVDQAYDGWFLPVLGVIVLPWTALFYAIAYAPIVGVEGFGVFFVLLGLLLDIATYVGGPRSRSAS